MIFFLFLLFWEWELPSASLLSCSRSLFSKITNYKSFLLLINNYFDDAQENVFSEQKLQLPCEKYSCQHLDILFFAFIHANPCMGFQLGLQLIKACCLFLKKLCYYSSHRNLQKSGGAVKKTSIKQEAQCNKIFVSVHRFANTDK